MKQKNMRSTVLPLNLDLSSIPPLFQSSVSSPTVLAAGRDLRHSRENSSTLLSVSTEIKVSREASLSPAGAESMGLRSQKGPFFVCVDGLISSGKSTLLSKLKEKGFITYPEPLDKWGKQLNKFYTNPKKEFLNMQSLVLNSQTALKNKLCRRYGSYYPSLPSSGDLLFPEILASPSVLPRYIFIERSHISQLYFISTGIKLNTITLSEAETFLQNWQKDVWLPHITVHMATPVSTCFSRLKLRNQVGDHAVSLDYLSLLDESYQQTYSQLEKNNHYSYLNYQPSDSIETFLKALDKKVLAKA